MAATDPTVDGKLYWLYTLLLTRFYNKDIPIVALVDPISYLNGTVTRALKDANMAVYDIQRFNQTNSRAAFLASKAVEYMNSFDLIYKPDTVCARNSTLPHCFQYYHIRMEMLIRFCWQADLAKELGVDYMLTIDADVALTDDILEAFGMFIGLSDVLTLKEWSSQVVLWRTQVLDDFCNAMVEQVQLPTEKLKPFFDRGNMLLPMLHYWSDMSFLSAYLRIINPEASSIVLCGRPTSTATNMTTGCTKLKWDIANSIGQVANKQCSNTDSIVEWRVNEENDRPELFTRHFRPGDVVERVPVIHYQGPSCKSLAGEHYRTIFVSRNLLPDL